MNQLPIFIRSLDHLVGEEWIDILGYDGIYNISNYGRVKSLFRIVNSSRGTQRKIKEKILKQNICKRYGESSVKLSFENISKTFRVCSLVYNAFMKDKEIGQEVCHLNKNKIDNRLSNLSIKTHSESKEINYMLGVMVDWGICQNSVKSKIDYLDKFGIYENGVLIGKVCVSCGLDRKESDFYKGNICKYCSLVKSGVVDLGKLTNRIDLAKKGLRYCSVCKELKKLDIDFGKNKGGFLGKSNNCKPCVKKMNTKYRSLKK